MPSKLCKYCSSILKTNDTSHHSHHSDAQALLGSAGLGCLLCIFLCDALENARWPEGTSFKGGSMKFYFKLGTEESTKGVSIPTVFFSAKLEGRKQRVWVQFRFTPSQTVSDRNLTNRVQPGDSTGGTEPWRKATHWLAKCINTHQKCRLPPQPRRLPTRLLDVGSHDRPNVHLHDTDGKLSSIPYITLSHCWGGVRPISLEKANYAALKRGLAIDKLPPTFQDAITITRRLGVRFLWIDSLCILQDSATDWARESSMMGSVYQNGLCNIAASAATNGHKGCFMHRDHLLAQPCEVRVDRDLSKIGLKKGLYDLVSGTLWDSGLSSAPLLQRAWVVQERVLSQRILHFGLNQLFWECKELDACEMYPAGAPEVLNTSNMISTVTGGRELGFRSLQFKNMDPALIRSEVSVQKTPWTIDVIPSLPSGQDIDPYYVWNKILIAYTRCLITRKSDNLVAISAVAKVIQGLARDEYLAGMWRRHLPYHLVWVAEQSIARRKRVKDQYVAPSWSWASMGDSPIQPYLYLRPDKPVCIEILSVGVRPVTSDIFGQVSAGHIKLRGWLRRFRVTMPPPESSGIRSSFSNVAEYDDVPVVGEKEVWFLPIVSLGAWVTFQSLGLMLVGTGNAGEFKRVGRYRAVEDLASAYFKVPTYPPEGQSKEITRPESVVHHSGKSEKRGWFGRRKEVDRTREWVEQVMTII